MHARISVSSRVTRGCLGLVLLCFLAQTARSETPSDALLKRLQPQGMLSDFARVLGAADRQAITLRLETLRQKTGAQVAVVTLSSLEGGEINDFTNKLFKRWGVGEKDQNNGVLLLVAIKDHKARI